MPIRASSSSRQRLLQPRPLFGRAVLAGALDLGPQPQLHLAGRLLGEGHRDDAVERAHPLADKRDDPTDQCGRLAGSGRRFDEEASCRSR